VPDINHIACVLPARIEASFFAVGQAKTVVTRHTDIYYGIGKGIQGTENWGILMSVTQAATDLRLPAHLGR
jgi:hypothetical protein